MVCLNLQFTKVRNCDLLLSTFRGFNTTSRNCTWPLASYRNRYGQHCPWGKKISQCWKYTNEKTPVRMWKLRHWDAKAKKKQRYCWATKAKDRGRRRSSINRKKERGFPLWLRGTLPEILCLISTSSRHSVLSSWWFIGKTSTFNVSLSFFSAKGLSRLGLSTAPCK